MHKNEIVCQSCDVKIAECHPRIQMLYRIIKTKHIDAHVCWGWRGQHDQDQFFFKGLSQERWPNSKHNYMENGKPCSKAMDLFRLDDKGQSQFEDEFYSDIWTEICSDPIGWRMF